MERCLVSLSQFRKGYDVSLGRDGWRVCSLTLLYFDLSPLNDTREKLSLNYVCSLLDILYPWNTDHSPTSVDIDTTSIFIGINMDSGVSPFSFCEVRTISPHRNMNKEVTMTP